VVAVTLEVVNNALVASQQWKLWICAFAVGLLGFFQIAPAWLIGLVELSEPVVLLGTATACVVIVFAAGSIRCPACRLALVWHAMQEQPVSRWLSWLLRVQSCPRCDSSQKPND